MLHKLLVVALLLAGTASAEEGPIVFGDWEVAVGDGVIVAGTSNDSGGTLGKVCLVDDGLCYWAVISKTTTCAPGQRTPIITNSSSGANAFTLVCSADKSMSNYQLFDEPDTMDAISANDPSISIVLPMEGDAFRVMRFSLRGSDLAVDAAVSASNNIRARSTRDITL
jgi:hypothetical protein